MKSLSILPTVAALLMTLVSVKGQYYDSTTDTEAAAFVDLAEQAGAFKESKSFSRIDAYMLAKTLGEIDRSTLSATAFADHLEQAEEIRTRFYPNMDSINFGTYLLPFRIRGENCTMTGWRKTLRDQLEPLIKDSATPQDAAPKILTWCKSKVHTLDGEDCYPLGLKGDLDPLTTLKLASGSEVDFSIFAVAALRSVGVAARLVTAPVIANEAGGKVWIEYRTDAGWIPWLAAAPDGINARKYITDRFGGHLTLVLANPDKPINITASYASLAHVSITLSNVTEGERSGWNLLVQGSDQLRPITGRNIYLHLSDTLDLAPGTYILVAGDRNNMSALKPFTIAAGQSLSYALDFSKRGTQTLDVADTGKAGDQDTSTLEAMNADTVLNPKLWR